MNLYKIFLAAGGSGGHIFPAYSLSKYLIKKKRKVTIITDKRGFKFLKNYSGIKIKTIISSTIFKNNTIKFIISIMIIFSAILNSLIFLFFNRPNIVIGMGGYSSFPICIAAKFLGIPFAIYENNLLIGKTNKYLLPFAKKFFISNPDIKGINHKYDRKIIKIGNIVREEILNYISKKKNKRTNTLNILILGGSQGAKIFGEKLPLIFKKCKKNNINFKITQQCQKNQNKTLDKFYKSNKINFKIFNFKKNILEYFKKVDLVITRSGSSIISELINCRIPFIAIPLPTASDNHQLLNAKYFEKKGCNFVIEEKDLETKIFPLIKLIDKDKSLLNRIIKKHEMFSDKNVFKNIEIEINNIIHEKSRHRK